MRRERLTKWRDSLSKNWMDWLKNVIHPKSLSFSPPDEMVGWHRELDGHESE